MGAQAMTWEILILAALAVYVAWRVRHIIGKASR